MFLTQSRARKAIEAVIAGEAPDKCPHWLAPLADYIQLTSQQALGVANGMVSVAQHVSTLGQGALEFDHRIANLVEKTQTLSAAIEEMSASAGEIGSLGENVLQQASNVSEHSAESSLALDDMEARFAEAGIALTRANDEMKTLSVQTNRIEILTKSVNEISEQTNLLALNAAIEAARAGDVGRGFAVVADEVRQLASRSADAAREINGIVGDIVSGADSVQARLISSVEAVQSSGESRERVAEVIRRVHDSSLHNVELAASIASAVEEQSQVSGDMAYQVSSNAEDADALSRIFSGFVGEITPLRETNEALFKHLTIHSPQMVLAAAKRDHVIWVDKIIRLATFNEQSITVEEVRDHTQCRLGKFLSSEAAHSVKTLNKAEQLINHAHPFVHKMGRELFEAAQAYHGGKIRHDDFSERSEKLIENLRVSSREVVALLDDMIIEIG